MWIIDLLIRKLKEDKRREEDLQQPLWIEPPCDHHLDIDDEDDDEKPSSVVIIDL